MDIQVETITPSMASQYLASQKVNRKCSPATVIRYCTAIKRGDWVLNGEAIKFSPDGVLIDGQHRLRAVVKADQPIKSLVIRGINGKSFETLDTGKNRSLSDLLSIYGYKDTAVLGGVARLACTHQIHGRAWLVNSNDRLVISNTTVSDFISNPRRRDALVEAARTGHTLGVASSFYSVTLAGYIWYVTHRYDQEVAESFFEAFNHSVREDDPVSLLCDRIAKDRLSKSHMSREEGLALTIKAWNYFAQNKPLERLAYRMVGKKAEAFPEFYGVTPEML